MVWWLTSKLEFEEIISWAWAVGAARRVASADAARIVRCFDLDCELLDLPSVCELCFTVVGRLMCWFPGCDVLIDGAVRCKFVVDHEK